MPMCDADGEHMVFNDPAYVLADVAAKRWVVEEVAGWPHDHNDDDSWYSCGMAVNGLDVEPGDREPGSGCSDESRAGMGCDCATGFRRETLLRLLALPYAGHPDYRPEWTPGVEGAGG